MNKRWVVFARTFVASLIVYTLTSERSAIGEYIFISLVLATLVTITIRPVTKHISDFVKRIHTRP